MSFGSNVRFYRINQRLTLQELSEKLNVSANYLSKLEQDKAKMKPEFLPNLCSALNVSMTDLYKEIKDNVFER